MMGLLLLAVLAPLVGCFGPEGSEPGDIRAARGSIAVSAGAELDAEELLLLGGEGLLRVGASNRLEERPVAATVPVSHIFRARGARLLFGSIDAEDGRQALWLEEAGAPPVKLLEHAIWADLLPGEGAVAVTGDRRLVMWPPATVAAAGDYSSTRQASRDAEQKLAEGVWAASLAPAGDRVAFWQLVPGRAATGLPGGMALQEDRAGEASSGYFDLAVMDLSSGEVWPGLLTGLQPPARTRGPSWSPDGHSLLALVDVDIQRLVVPQPGRGAGQELRRVPLPSSMPLPEEEPLWLPGDLLVYSFPRHDDDTLTYITHIDRPLDGRQLRGSVVAVEPRKGRLLLAEKSRLHLYHLDPADLQRSLSFPVATPGTAWSVSYTIKFRRPIAAGTLTSWFSHDTNKYDCTCNNPPWNPSYCRPNHGGTDIADGLGAPIYASAAGTVVYTEKSCGANDCKTLNTSCGSGYGNYVKLKHSNGMYTIYAHMQKLVSGIADGSAVSCGTVIGYVGSTGSSTGCHIHFEIQGTLGWNERLDPFYGSCNKTVTASLWTSVSNGQPGTSCGSSGCSTSDEGKPCDTGKPGICAAGVTACSDGKLVCKQTYSATAEVCDGKDNNCDGKVDEGNPGGGASCNTGKPGICAAGVMTCTGGKLVCKQTHQPGPEVCDGKDNNCDGKVDEGGVCGPAQPDAGAPTQEAGAPVDVLFDPPDSEKPPMNERQPWLLSGSCSMGPAAQAPDRGAAITGLALVLLLVFRRRARR